MFTQLKKVFENKVFQNGLWLYALQFFSTIVPLFTLPYITRVLGPSQYGIFSFSLIIITYFQAVVEYGFDLSGSRKIALSTDKKEHALIFTRILSAKIFLCISAFLLLLVSFYLFDLDFTERVTMLALFTLVIGTSLQQTWLFQGLQRMKFITLINLLSRSISVILIFLFVKSESDLYLYAFLYSITILLNGIISLIIIKNKLNITLSKISWRDIIEELKDGWHTFTTSAMSKIFGGIGILVLGISSPPSVVGIYAAIQKIPYILVMFYAPVGQALFPHISQQFNISYYTGRSLLKKIWLIVIPLTLSMGFFLVLFSEFTISLLYGESFLVHSYVFAPLVGWFVLSVTNNLLGIQNLVANGKLKEYSKAFNLSVLLLVSFNIVLGWLWGILGVALASFLVEGILTLLLIYQIKKVEKVYKNEKNLM